MFVEVTQIHIWPKLLLDIINAESVGDKLYDTDVRPGAQNFVRCKLQLQFPLFKDEVDGFN